MNLRVGILTHKRICPLTQSQPLCVAAARQFTVKRLARDPELCGQVLSLDFSGKPESYGPDVRPKAARVPLEPRDLARLQQRLSALRPHHSDTHRNRQTPLREQCRWWHVAAQGISRAMYGAKAEPCRNAQDTSLAQSGLDETGPVIS